MSSLKGLMKSAPSTCKHFFKEELEVPFLHEWLSELSSGQAASSVGYNEFSHVGESLPSCGKFCLFTGFLRRGNCTSWEN